MDTPGDDNREKGNQNRAAAMALASVESAHCYLLGLLHKPFSLIFNPYATLFHA